MRKLALASLFVAVVSCRFDPSYRDVPESMTVACTAGVVECRGAVLTRCDSGNPTVIDDCGSRGLACAPTLLACTPCIPAQTTCDGTNVVACDPSGQRFSPSQTCDTAHGIACRQGVCANLCLKAAKEQSNVGCEVWAVDLDNAVTSQGNAAEQQFAVVLSNPQPDLVAHVVVEEDRSVPGTPPQIRVVGTATVGPRNLEVFKLGPNEVDGSADGTFNTGTGTALTRHAYKITTDVPIVAYQFNPLENVNVFSNDASQLLPVSALGSSAGRAYVVAGWPQTIATSEIAAQNFGLDLRAFLAIVATRADTHVHVKTTARVMPGGPLPSGLPVGGEVDVTLQPFEVLNLETGDFNADFTGTLVDADHPVALFPGSEASDAPFFSTLADRFCCADHLEEQGIPVRAAGKSYVVGRVPNRSRAVAAAGGSIAIVDEPEFYRVVATRKGATHVTTTLPPPDDAFDLADEGANRTLVAHQDFSLDASQAVILSDTQASQEAAGVPRGLPGGDPSLTFLSPVEQWRSDYVLLTPDKYVFDFLVVTAPSKALVYIDGLPVDGKVCEVGPADGLTETQRGSSTAPFLAYRCQLSFPVIDPSVSPPNNVSPGRQNDGVHRVQADYPVGVLVYGFDSFVSYAYSGGTQLAEINVE